MKKLLTLIVPACNMERYLVRCLRSIAAVHDGMDLLEVVVVNDGSRDRTSEIAHDFEKQHPQTFRVVDKANGHYGSCINVALPLARGTYVKILDADDSFTPAGLRELLHLIEGLATDGPELILTDYDIVDEDDKIYAHRCYPYKKNELISLAEYAKGCKNVQMHGLTYRTSLLTDLEYRQLEGCAYTDVEWTFLPTAVARTAYYLPVSVYRYFVGRSGQSMDPSVYAKGLDARMRIISHMANQMTRVRPQLSQSGVAYAEWRLAVFVRTQYEFIVFQSRMSKLNKLFDEFDAFVSKLDRSLYDRLAEVRIPSRHGLRYIRFLRQSWREVRLLTCGALRIYSLAARMARG